MWPWKDVKVTETNMNRLEKELNKGNDCAQLKRSGLKYVSENANGKVPAVALVVSAYNASTINHP